jgi:hypothetical protein
MQKFKAGDTVERVKSEFAGMYVGDRAVVRFCTGRGALSGHYHYLLEGYPLEHSEYNLKLVQEGDDPLPPAPEVVMYHSDNNPDRRLDVSCATDCLMLYSRKVSQHDVTVLRLDPDAALQLAHDLTRMAMQIKREQRDSE